MNDDTVVNLFFVNSLVSLIIIQSIHSQLLDYIKDISYNCTVKNIKILYPSNYLNDVFILQLSLFISPNKFKKLKLGKY